LSNFLKFGLYIFVVKNINIYVFKYIYYENIFHNQSNHPLFDIKIVSIYSYRGGQSKNWMTPQKAKITFFLGQMEY